MVVEKDLTWSQAYEKTVEKDLDVLPCVAKTPEREQYFIYSDPYCSFQRVIFIEEYNDSINRFEDIYDKSIAVQGDSSHHSFLKQFPSIQLILYPTVEEALRAVSDGKADAFVGNYATSSYLMKDMGISNLKYLNIESEEEQSLYFAVRNDWPELASIINKGLAAVTEEERISINNRWIGPEKQTDYSAIIRIVAMVGSVLALIIIISFYWIVRLKKEVAARIKVQEDLKIAREEAESANHIKSAFLARMSHEIRTPLNAITGLAYLMKKTEVTMTQVMYLDKIAQASRNMLGIINDILDFSKIEAGKIQIDRLSFDLDRIIQQVINIVSFQVEEQGIEFLMDRDPHLPTLYFGDPKRLEQILLNVVSNAVKFTPAGSVFLSIRSVANTDDHYRLEFRVQDTGIGISDEQIGKLFSPFDQGDSSIGRRFGGTGLGLSIVKNLLEMMGGDIEVYSTLDKGSTFVIHLDLEADRDQEDAEKDESAALYFQSIRTLVIEKNTMYANLIKGYLHSFSMSADFASSEEEATMMIAKASMKSGTPYNLLIIDHETPAGGGMEFYARISSILTECEAPKCILMVPLARDDLFDRIEAAGIDFGITKPIIPSLLYNGIVEIFKLKVLAVYDQSPLSENPGAVVADYPYHVLVVEDNKTNQFIAKSLLEQSGFMVSLSDNGQEGYDFFIKHQLELDAILMDLHMPVMSGYDSAVLIRKIDVDIPIIAMTADAIAGVDEKCQNAGINHYVSKPFEPEHFAATILQFVKPHHGRIRPEQEDAGRSSGIPVENEPVLDENDGLRRIGGNTDLYRAVLNEFYEENKDLSKLLANKIEQNDYAAASQLVHKIKGSSGNIGARSLFNIAADLQNSLHHADVMAVSGLTNKFLALLTRLLSEIEQKLASP